MFYELIRLNVWSEMSISDNYLMGVGKFSRKPLKTSRLILKLVAQRLRVSNLQDFFHRLFYDLGKNCSASFMITYIR